MYFQKFPLLSYTANNNINFSVVTDIIRRVSIAKEIKENLSLYDEYDVREGETPEIVSAKLYGNPEYHWVILLMNDVIDPRYDWVLSQDNLDQYIESKYGSGNVYAVHHYVSSSNNSLIVDSDYIDARAVTNQDYEIEENEKKRTIRVLKPSFLNAISSEFDKIINV